MHQILSLKAVIYVYMKLTNLSDVIWGNNIPLCSNTLNQKS